MLHTIQFKKWLKNLFLVADFSTLTLLLSSFNSIFQCFILCRLYSLSSLLLHAVAENLTHNTKMIDGKKPIFHPETVFGLLFSYRNIHVSKEEKKSKSRVIKSSFFSFFSMSICSLLLRIRCCVALQTCGLMLLKFSLFSSFFYSVLHECSMLFFIFDVLRVLF